MITASIVSFNTSGLLEKVLKQLQSQKGSGKIETWVVDNNSADDSVDMLKKKFPAVHLIESDKNSGFASGQNLALKKITSDLVLILNPDTLFPDDACQKMVEFMNQNPEIGISSCKIRDQNGNLGSNGGGLPVGLPLLSWLFNLDSLGLPSFHRADQKFYHSKNAGWTGGTFMVVRREVFEKAGFFNEDYFMYFEDVDFCYRAGKKGFKIGFNPDLEITHFSGASSKNPRYTQWSGEFKGLLIFSYKNFGFLYGVFVSILTYAAIILRIIAFALLLKLDYAKIYTKVLFNL